MLNTMPRLLPRAGWLPLLLLLCGGCTAMTNPLADGIPVRLLPPELMGPAKTNYQTVPLSLLRQPQPDAYKLDAGDVLGVFVEGYLGEKPAAIPTHVAPLVLSRDQNRLPPSAGYPVPVQENGQIALPGVEKLLVRGMTVGDARDAIVKLYNPDAKLIRVVKDQIIVTLLHPRQTQVLVFRQEAQSFQTAARTDRFPSANATPAISSISPRTRTTCCKHWCAPAGCRSSTLTTKSSSIAAACATNPWCTWTRQKRGRI